MDPFLPYVLGGMELNDELGGHGSPMRVPLHAIHRDGNVYYHAAKHPAKHSAKHGGEEYAQLRRMMREQEQHLEAHRRASISDDDLELQLFLAEEAEHERNDRRQSASQYVPLEHMERVMRKLKVATAARDAAVLELADEREDREAAVRELSEEREEREATELLLQDMFEDLRSLQARNTMLEHSLAAFLLERERRPVAEASPPASASAEPPGFNLSHTRIAIEEAVKEAAKLPEEERKKKIRALRLKWHPDKHDVLKEMANEVTKMINEAVERCDKDSGSGK